MKLHSVRMSLIALGLLLAAAVAQAQTPVGRASRITGEQFSSAQAPGGPVRKLAEGDSLFAGERIRTGAGTVLQIEFTDKSRFTLGPNAEFEVEKYFQAAGGTSGEEAFASRVFKGAFRYVSGLIARKKRQNVRITIAVATIGIRGTHFEGEVTERQEKDRSEEHTSELQSRENLVCRLLLEKKKKNKKKKIIKKQKKQKKTKKNKIK